MAATTHKEKMARIDERTLNIWRVVEKMEQHMDTMNGAVGDNRVRSRVNRYLVMAVWAALISVSGFLTKQTGIW